MRSVLWKVMVKSSWSSFVSWSCRHELSLPQVPVLLGADPRTREGGSGATMPKSLAESMIGSGSGALLLDVASRQGETHHKSGRRAGASSVMPQGPCVWSGCNPDGCVAGALARSASDPAASAFPVPLSRSNRTWGSSGDDARTILTEFCL
ncbi:unnamed protein product [Polarella glacialis]|uniref:Uncharacterized protein n=1 Tax=Polarella glacialis TaxID=89957 RepID=A0A813DHY2_POLGL|nr:unnamed protein product [Polarella glacialis]